MNIQKNGTNDRIGALIDGSVQNIADMLGADAVIGTPVVTATGFQLIPVSKVTVGYLAGGGEYGETKILRGGGVAPFAGGNGAVVSVRPAGFILDDGKNCTYIHAGDDPLDNLIDKAGSLAAKLAERDG